MRWLLIGAVLATASIGCGTQHSAGTTQPTTTDRVTTAHAPTGTTVSSGPGALQAEANAAAAGDIPDNQVFLRFENARAGYSLKYPEGWAQQGSNGRVVFRDKNNIVRIAVARGQPLTIASITRESQHLAGAHIVSPPVAVSLPSGHAFKVVYKTESAANAVTGKRVTLVVDRYYLTRAGRQAVVDLGTPVGVDNVDAYRLMIESFRWK